MLDVEKRISNLERMVATLTEDKAGLKKENAELKKEKAELVGQVATLTEDKAGLKNQIGMLVEQVTDLMGLVHRLTDERDASRETSSALAARNIRAKPNKTGTRKSRKVSHHKRSSRTRPEKVDEEHTADRENCIECGSRMSKPVGTYKRMIEDINIPIPTIKKQYTVVRRYCKKCKKTRTAPVPDALPNSMFGIRLTLFVISLKMLGLSYQKIAMLLKGMFGLRIKESTMNKMTVRVSDAFGDRYNEMIEELKREDNVNGDETSWRVDGRNHWLWAFVTKWTVIYEINRSRGREVPKRVLEGYTGTVGADSWGPWNHVGSMQQKCHVHYKREIKETIECKRPTAEFAPFARRLKKILDDSHEYVGLDEPDAQAAVKRLGRRIDKIISIQYKDRHCKRFVKRLKREKDMLFTFILTGIEWHNNRAERAIRPNVLIRKNTNGHRTKDGADAHAVLMSINETCRMRDLNFYDYSVGYLADRASKT